MVKDYKQMPTVEYEAQAGGAVGARESDSKNSSSDEANGDDQTQKKTGGALDFEGEIPVGKLDFLSLPFDFPGSIICGRCHATRS